ncbi:hypothetical protein MVI01_13600 [Myxococcus virescens]|uniref:Uncharacterized protein n=1 Tax=Myxococcus virescens TaxID=83456 RepID=A0A511H7R6_9BACT|nr:hypothetical protein MVI01_13600 [Myxococcus virescens]
MPQRPNSGQAHPSQLTELHDGEAAHSAYTAPRKVIARVDMSVRRADTSALWVDAPREDAS